MFVIVSYDITNDRRRNKVAKALKDFGIRVQYSVFECRLPPRELKKMKQKVAAIIKDDEDSVRIYQLCEPCAGRVEILGQGSVTEDPSYLIL